MSKLGSVLRRRSPKKADSAVQAHSLSISAAAAEMAIGTVQTPLGGAAWAPIRRHAKIDKSHNVTTTPSRSSRTARSKWRQQLRQATTDATVQIWLETPAPTLFNNDGLCRAAALGDGPAEDLHQVAEHETRGPQPRGQGPRPGPARWRTCSPASLRSLSRPSSPAWPRPAS